MRNVGVLEAPHNVHYGVTFAYVRQKFVAQTLALRSALNKPRNVNELHNGGSNFFAVIERGELIQPLVGHGNHAHIGLDGAEGVVCSLCARVRYSVEQCGLAHVGQTYYA